MSVQNLYILIPLFYLKNNFQNLFIFLNKKTIELTTTKVKKGKNFLQIF